MRLGVIMIAALAIIIVITVFTLPFRAIERDAILRYIAPTTFETRSIEEILEGVSP